MNKKKHKAKKSYRTKEQHSHKSKQIRHNRRIHNRNIKLTRRHIHNQAIPINGHRREHSERAFTAKQQKLHIRQHTIPFFSMPHPRQKPSLLRSEGVALAPEHNIRKAIFGHEFQLVIVPSQQRQKSGDCKPYPISVLLAPPEPFFDDVGHISEVFEEELENCELGGRAAVVPKSVLHDHGRWEL
jgi:hypothetical protein